MQLSQKIIVFDNVLSDIECENLQKFFRYSKIRNSSFIETYRDTEILHISPDTKDAYACANKISKMISFISDQIEIDWSQIVQWPEGSEQAYHLDSTSSDTVFTSITYLNDDYDGGETSFLNDLKIVPKIGRTVCFDGNYYTHGVSRINKGTRYTLPIWYKRISVV